MKYNLEYIISLVAALFSAYLIKTGSPNVNPYITFLIVPLLIAYLVVQIINNVFPSLNRWGQNVQYYIEDKSMSQINSMGYLQIFPPLFAVLIVFALLLYNRQLG